MASEARRAGITPLVLRQAAYYAFLGLGEYRPKGYAQFDRVVVRPLLPWVPNVADPIRGTQVLVVEFFDGDRRTRYVEFAMTLGGFGGEATLREVD